MRNLLPGIDVIPVGLLLAAPVVCLLFIGICFLVWSKRRKKVYEEISKFPFQE